jgi:hypothetical protein
MNHEHSADGIPFLKRSLRAPAAARLRQQRRDTVPFLIGQIARIAPGLPPSGAPFGAMCRSTVAHQGPRRARQAPSSRLSAAKSGRRVPRGLGPGGSPPKGRFPGQRAPDKGLLGQPGYPPGPRDGRIGPAAPPRRTAGPAKGGTKPARRLLCRPRVKESELPPAVADGAQAGHDRRGDRRRPDHLNALPGARVIGASWIPSCWAVVEGDDTTIGAIEGRGRHRQVYRDESLRLLHGARGASPRDPLGVRIVLAKAASGTWET